MTAGAICGLWGGLRRSPPEAVDSPRPSCPAERGLPRGFLPIERLPAWVLILHLGAKCPASWEEAASGGAGL